jgi:hypothetical protein
LGTQLERPGSRLRRSIPAHDGFPVHSPLPRPTSRSAHQASWLQRRFAGARHRTIETIQLLNVARPRELRQQHVREMYAGLSSLQLSELAGAMSLEMTLEANESN